MEKSKGQLLVNEVEAWFRGYVVTTNVDLPLVLALWAIGSWVFDRFYAWPYLTVTAATKGAGKSTVLKLLKGITRNPFHGVNPSPPFILREIKKSNGHFTLLWDEAEMSAASDGKSFFSEVINSGYTKGQQIGRAKGPDDTVRYDSYCPKAFALIGDPTGTILDRSIVAELYRANPEREFIPEIAFEEADGIKAAILAVLATGDSKVASAPPAWLDTRGREIWASVFGLANWLKLDKATVARLAEFSNENVALKGRERRKASNAEGEEKALEDAYAQRALKDLASVVKPGERAIFSAEAIERMHALPLTPWKVYRGKGLDAGTLARLVGRFGLQSRQVRKDKGRLAKQLNGYSADDIKATYKG